MIQPLSEEYVRKHGQSIIEIASDVPGEYWRLEEFLRPMTDKWTFSFCWSADSDDRPQGYVVASRRRGRYHIHHLMVAPAWRGRRIGNLLLNEAERHAAAAGILTLSLKVHRTNRRALEFYRQHGFSVVRDGAGAAGEYLALEKRIGSNRVVAIHQPNYFPWAGYFYKMAHCDTFLFLDDAQFSKHNYINRTRIKTPQGARWLTVPVNGSTRQTIAQTRLTIGNWRSTHLKTLQGAYAKATHFKRVFPWVTDLFERARADQLAELNMTLIMAVAHQLGVTTPCRCSSDCPSTTKSTARLVELVHAVGGTRYLSGQGAVAYQDADAFRQSGVALVYSEFQSRPYRQLWGPFAPGLSILDLVFNLGFEDTAAYLTR